MTPKMWFVPVNPDTVGPAPPLRFTPDAVADATNVAPAANS
jgi:hypothetical protein